MPGPRPHAVDLTADMAGIGMNFVAKPNIHANIEDTLVYASEWGMEDNDLRVLAVLTTWLGVHHIRINADRLVRVVVEHPSERVRAYWAAVATWLARDHRLAGLATAYDGPTTEILPVGTQFQIARRGEDERFAGTVLRVPAGTLRNRTSDVMSPAVMTRLHLGYRNRVRMGPSWRADVWTILECEPGLSVAEVARSAYCSFATAWQIAQDFKLMQLAERPSNLD
jgi:hypothetical protein